jgi:hypothetical protein
MTTQDPISASSAIRSCGALLRDDSVRLFDAGRTLFGAFITASLFLVAHFWL